MWQCLEHHQAPRLKRYALAMPAPRGARLPIAICWSCNTATWDNVEKITTNLHNTQLLATTAARRLEHCALVFLAPREARLPTTICWRCNTAPWDNAKKITTSLHNTHLLAATAARVRGFVLLSKKPPETTRA